MLEPLSYNQIQQVLCDLLAQSTHPLLRQTLSHTEQGPQALFPGPDNAYDYTQNYGLITVNRSEYSGLGFSLRPSTKRNVNVRKIAKALSKFYEERLGVRATLRIEQTKSHGLFFNDYYRHIGLSFSNRDALVSALQNISDPKTQQMIAVVREERMAREEAQAIELEEKRRLHAIHEAYLSRKKGKAFIRGEPLIPEALSLVHATNYLPRLKSDGTAEVETTLTSTKGELFRNTIHFALNHKVVGHSMGSWDDAPYTVIGDFNEAMAVNGAPTCLSTVDTWWVRDLDEPLRIPNALIVKPGVPENGLREMSLTEAIYKDKNFTLAETIALLGLKIDDDGKSQSTLYGGDLYLHQDATRCLQSLLRTEDINGHISEQEVDALVWGPLLELAQKQPQLELKNAILHEPHFQLIAQHAEAVEKIIGNANNTQTINAALDHLGYHIYLGANWAWGGSWDVDTSTKALASILHTKASAHTDTPQERFEKAMHAFLGTDDGYSDQRAQYLLELFPLIDARTQRAAMKTLEIKGREPLFAKSAGMGALRPGVTLNTDFADIKL